MLWGVGLKAQIILGSSHLNFDSWSSSPLTLVQLCNPPELTQPPAQPEHLSKAKRGSNEAKPCGEMVA